MTNLIQGLPVAVSVRKEPVRARSTARITALLDGAAALIDERGLDYLTTSDVATRSGSSVGVLYRYFPNIQSLLSALTARNLQRFGDRVSVALASTEGDWKRAAMVAIDIYVDLMRYEPGFRALGFGDEITMRVVEPDISNSTALAREFTRLMTTEYGFEDTDELAFDIEIVIEIAAALVRRAFLYSTEGDERFIESARQLINERLGRHRDCGAA